MYRLEMNCQVIHDSIHGRAGWSREFLLLADGVPAGYGSLAIAGPWKDKWTLYEFFLIPKWRARCFDFFAKLIADSKAVMIETQTNGPLLGVMIHAFAKNVESEAILFHDKLTTALPSPGGTFRKAAPGDNVEDDWVIECDGAVAARGGILYHYNPPYGDIYMNVAEGFRGQGYGSYLVQELKRVAYEAGNIPGARCNIKNDASRKTLTKAGFVPCGHILHGDI
jgi:GNAT superfamily N-acetyltransferase